MAHQPRRNIEKARPEFFSVRWSLEEGDENRRMLVHREQVRAYFRFNAALRRGKDCPPYVPCGYAQFCNAYAHEATTLSRFTTFEQDEDGSGHIIINGRTPTIAEVLGPNADLRRPEEREGGEVLNGAEAAALRSMLWEAADKVKRQRQYAQRGYSTRQDKRGNRHNERGSLTERIVDSSYRGNKSNQKYRGKKRQRTDIDDTRFSPSVAPFVEFISMNTAGSSRLHVETEDMGVYEDEEGMYDEELGKGEVIADQEMVGERQADEGAVDKTDKPVEDKGKAVDRM